MQSIAQTDWQPYAPTQASGQHTVVGTLLLQPEMYSPQLDRARAVYVYLPPSYSQGTQRYPVIYMHDGQNLFDQVLSYAGEWQVDETMESLSHEGYEAIIVGIANAETYRLDEYTPFRDARGMGGRGANYVAFLVDTVKPLIDRDFRTLPDRAETGVIGSSLGGLISLFAFFHRPDVFGVVGALSPSLWFAQESIFPYVEQQPFVPGKVYLDAGTAEDLSARRRSLPATRIANRSPLQRMGALLERKGYRIDHDLRIIEEQGGIHHESAWARRLPDALRFLLPRV